MPSTARSSGVSYKVENTREGQILDYDKLSMQIETNGTVSPEDALAYAARILQDQLQLFINFEEPSVERREEAMPEPEFQPQPAEAGRRARAVRALRQTASRTTTSSISAT